MARHLPRGTKVRQVLLVLAVGWPAWAGAQQLYRCGNTFSQTPCGTDPSGTKLPAAAVPDVAAGLRGADLCIEHVAPRVSLSGALASRVLWARRTGTEVIQYAGQPTAVRRYVVAVDPRAESGDSAARPTFQCFLSEDERRVLLMSGG